MGTFFEFVEKFGWYQANERAFFYTLSRKLTVVMMPSALALALVLRVTRAAIIEEMRGKFRNAITGGQAVASPVRPFGQRGGVCRLLCGFLDKVRPAQIHG